MVPHVRKDPARDQGKAPREAKAPAMKAEAARAKKTAPAPRGKGASAPTLKVVPGSRRKAEAASGKKAAAASKRPAPELKAVAEPEAPPQRRKRAETGVTAEEMGARQREISVSEF